MNNFEMDRRAKQMADSNTAYNLAKRNLMLEEQLEDTRRESWKSQQLKGVSDGNTREAFEGWYETTFGSRGFCRHTDHSYKNRHTELMWSGFVAACNWKSKEDQGEAAETERQTSQLIDERDHWEEMASKLAYMVGDHFGFDVGEHSNCNCPVQNALQWDWSPSPAAVPDTDKETIAIAAGHLGDWLDLHECECEMGHICGRNNVERTRQRLLDMLAAPAPAEPQEG